MILECLNIWKTLPFRLSCRKTWPRAVPVFFFFLFFFFRKNGESWNLRKLGARFSSHYLHLAQVGVVGATGAVGEEMIEVENVKL